MKKPRFCGVATIYALCDENDTVFYVGCTTKDPKVRLYGHIQEAKANEVWQNQHKNNKIRSLNYVVFVRVLEAFPVKGSTVHAARKKGEKVERLWIKAFLRMGAELTNKVHGNFKYIKGGKIKRLSDGKCNASGFEIQYY